MNLHQRSLSLKKSSYARELCKDVVDFFQGRRAGHMGKWLYSSPLYEGDRACGANALAKVVHASKSDGQYYIFRNEQSIIQDAANKIASLLDSPARLIDLGPGSSDAVESKALPIINASSCIKEYVAVDICDETNKIATSLIRNKSPAIHTREIHKNFFEDSFKYGPPLACEIALCFGLTAFNMEIDPRVKGLAENLLGRYLKRLFSHFSSSQNFLAITQDINQNEEILRNAYQGDFYNPLLYLIGRDLHVTGYYYPDAFTVDVDFFKETKALSLCFIPQEDMEFEVEGYPCHIRKNDRLYFLNSYKFDQDTFFKVSKSENLSLIETVEQQNNTCVFHILKAA